MDEGFWNVIQSVLRGPSCGNDFCIIGSTDEVHYSQATCRNRHASTNADSFARHNDFIVRHNPRGKCVCRRAWRQSLTIRLVYQLKIARLRKDEAMGKRGGRKWDRGAVKESDRELDKSNDMHGENAPFSHSTEDLKKLKYVNSTGKFCLHHWLQCTKMIWSS